MVVKLMCCHRNSVSRKPLTIDDKQIEHSMLLISVQAEYNYLENNYTVKSYSVCEYSHSFWKNMYFQVSYCVRVSLSIVPN